MFGRFTRAYAGTKRLGRIQQGAAPIWAAGQQTTPVTPVQRSPVPYLKIVAGEAFSYNLGQHFSDWHSMAMAPGSPALQGGVALSPDGWISAAVTPAAAPAMNNFPIIRLTNASSGLTLDVMLMVSVAEKPAYYGAPTLTRIDANTVRVTRPAAPANTPPITSIDILHGSTLPLDPATGVTMFNVFLAGAMTKDITLPDTVAHHVTLRGKIAWGDGTNLTPDGATGGWSPNTATIAATPTNSAPAIITEGTISPATGPTGTEFTLTPPTASGTPAPNVGLQSLTQAGADVLGQVAAGKFTSTAPGALVATWLVSNGVAPDATSTASASIASILTEPGQMGQATAEVISASQIDVTLAPDPQNGGATITSRDLRYSLDQVNWTLLSGLVANEKRSISTLSSSTVYYFESRAINSVGPGAWSPVRSAMTNAAAGTVYRFGQFTAVGAAGVSIAAPDGTYGQFTVSAGKISPAVSPLTVGTISIVGINIEVVAGEVSVGTLAEFTAARSALGTTGGRTIRFRSGSYAIGLGYILASAAYASRVRITAEAGAVFVGNAVLDSPSNVTVDNLDIHCTTPTGTAYVLRLAGACDGCIVEDNYLHGVTRDPLGDFSVWQSYQNPDQGILADQKGGIYLKNCIIRRNWIEHVDEGIVTYYGGDGPYIVEDNMIGYTYSDAIKYVISTTAALSAPKKWNRNQWYMMMGRQDDEGPTPGTGVIAPGNGPHSDFHQLVRSAASDGAYVDNVEICQNIWVLTSYSRAQNIQGIVSFADGGNRPTYRNARITGNFSQSDSVHAVSLKMDGGILAHNTLIRTLAPKLPAPLGKGTLKVRFYLEIPAGAVKPKLIRNVCDWAPQLYGAQAAVDEYDNIYLGDAGATIPYATAFANGGVEAANWTQTLANYTLKAGGPLDLPFGRGAFGSAIGTYGPNTRNPAGWSYDARLEEVAPQLAPPPVTAMIMGQSEPEYLLDNSGYSLIPQPVPGNDNLVVITQSGSLTPPVRTSVNPTTVAAGQVNVTMASLSAFLNFVRPGYKFVVGDGCVSGTSRYSLMNDQDTGRYFSDFAAVHAVIEAEFGTVKNFIECWYNSDAQPVLTFKKSFWAFYFGQKSDGTLYTLGNPIGEGFNPAAIAHHCLFDAFATPGTKGRGLFPFGGGDINWHMISPMPFHNAPVSPAPEATQFYQGQRNSEPTRAIIDGLTAEPNAQALNLKVGPSAHLCDFGGGIHPVLNSPDGQILMSWPFAIALLRASGMTIGEPSIVGVEGPTDGSYLDVVVDLPNGGTLTTLRLVRQQAMPAAPSPHQQQVTGFELARTGGTRPVFKTTETAYPAQFRGTVTISDPGSGSPRRGRARIVPEQPFVYGDEFGGYLKGQATAVLSDPRDVANQLYKDMLVEHIPAFYDPAALYPFEGIAVKPYQANIPVPLPVPAFTPKSAGFNGTTSRLSSTTLSVPAANELVAAGWLYMPVWGSAQSLLQTRIGTGINLNILTSSGGRLQVVLSGVATFATPTSTFQAGRWHHFALSVRGGSSPRYQLCVDGGAPIGGTPVPTDVTLTMNGQNITRVGLGYNLSSGYFPGSLGHWLLDLQASVDLADPTVRAKFFNGKVPADLGANGELLLGRAPQFYLSGGAGMTNFGTGGALTPVDLAEGASPALP